MADHVVRLDRSAMDRGAPGLARLLGGFDVVNAHNFPAMWWVAAARASAALPPVVWYCNEPSRSLYPGLFDGPSFSARAPDTDLARHDRACARAADVLIGNSAYVRDRVAAIYDRQDVRVVHCAIPLPPAPPPRLPARVLRVLMVSRLTVEKNVETAIDAVGRLDRVALRIIGDGPERAALEAFARPLGDRVTFEGFLDDDSLRAAYAEADAFIYLPRGEPFGLTLLEAGAAGLPSITSSHGGPAEIVIDGETGLLVDPSSVDEVTGALGLLRDDPAARHLGEAARQRVESHFTIDRYVRDMEAVFSKLRT
jgi:glycosyltransferase involved in cell wall biosynthesis